VGFDIRKVRAHQVFHTADKNIRIGLYVIDEPDGFAGERNMPAGKIHASRGALTYGVNEFDALR
jgi:hypothetical protein